MKSGGQTLKVKALSPQQAAIVQAILQATEAGKAVHNLSQRLEKVEPLLPEPILHRLKQFAKDAARIQSDIHRAFSSTVFSDEVKGNILSKRNKETGEVPLAAYVDPKHLNTETAIDCDPVDDVPTFEITTDLLTGDVSKAAAAAAWEAWSYETAEKLKSFCSVCGTQQVSSPGGATCANAHGGAEPKELDVGHTRSMLALVYENVPDEQFVGSLTQEQRYEAIAWAGACHLAASDNEGVIVPKIPKFLVTFSP